MLFYNRTRKTVIVIVMAILFSGSLKSVVPDIGLPVIRCDVQQEPPTWALYERQLIDTLNRAGIEFYDTYVLEDGSLEWKERYEGGMNSSDDLYEAFRGYSLLTAMGGSDEIRPLRSHRLIRIAFLNSLSSFFPTLFQSL